MLDRAEYDDLIQLIRDDINARKIQLPTLPEVALRVRDAVESDDADAASIAKMVASDTALSARLLQVANSPLYRGLHEIDSIQQAITRLGLRLVRSLVVSIAMKQIFQATSDALDSEFRQIWDDSLQIAAISRMLAGAVAGLENEQAMLGGLIHNIGALPILTKIDELWGFDASKDLICAVIADLGPEVGTQILQHWNFSTTLANIPAAVNDFAYDPGPAPTYADIVLVARWQHLVARGKTDGLPDPANIPAFAKIGMEPEIVVTDIADSNQEIDAVRGMLEG
jgi:HD-like signal output (HDOD) protein